MRGVVGRLEEDQELDLSGLDWQQTGLGGELADDKRKEPTKESTPQGGPIQRGGRDVISSCGNQVERRKHGEDFIPWEI